MAHSSADRNRRVSFSADSYRRHRDYRLGPDVIQQAPVSLSKSDFSDWRSRLDGGCVIPCSQWPSHLYHGFLAGNHGVPPQAELRRCHHLYSTFHSCSYLHVEFSGEVGGYDEWRKSKTGKWVGALRVDLYACLGTGIVVSRARAHADHAHYP